MIMGEEKSDKGEFIVGETAKIAYVDQAHSNIDTEKSIWQNFSDEQELVMMGGRPERIAKVVFGLDLKSM